MSLRPDQVRRYARHILLPGVGGKGQGRLLSAVVRVSEPTRAAAVALVYLAAAGVGTLVLPDDGVVESADGFLFETGDVGRPWRDAARDRLTALNPDVSVVREGNAQHTLSLGEAADPIDALAHGSRAASRVIQEIVAP